MLMYNVKLAWKTYYGNLFLYLRMHDLPIHGVSNTVVGVLGGGQLGRMLCQAASKMAIRVATLDPLENCPASALSYEHVVGSFNDGDAIREFAKRSVLYGFIRSWIL